MSTLSQASFLTSWLKFEEDNLFCREQVTVYTSAGLLPSGTVLGASGPLAFGSPYDGSGVGNVAPYDGDTTYTTAVGILIEPVDASAGPVKGAMICRGPAIVDYDGLNWGSQDTGDRTEGVTDLEALGIIFREGA
jgi:hypothetical protein